MRTRTRRVLIGVVVAGVLLLGVRDLVIRLAAGTVVRRLTGFELRAERLRVGLIAGTLEVHDLELLNPPDFPMREAIRIRRAYVRYAPGILISRELHLRAVELDLPELVVIRKVDGETNLERLGKVGSSADGKSETDKAAEPAETRPLRIDHLVIKLGEARYVDYSVRRDPPRIRKFRLDVERTYTDVTSLNRVAASLSAEVLAQGAARIAEGLGRKLRDGGDVEKLEGGVGKFGNFLNRAFRKTEPRREE